MTKKITTLDVEHDDEIEISKKIKYKDPGDKWENYIGITKPKMKYSKKISPNIFNSLLNVSKSANSLFMILMEHTNPYTNLCLYSIKYFNHSQTTSYNRKLAELIKANIYKRARTIDEKEPIPKGSLMLNPYLIFPSNNLGKAKKNWDLM